jgi:hypothetical protein
MPKAKVPVYLLLDVDQHDAMTERVEQLGVSRSAFIRAAIAASVEGGHVQVVRQETRKEDNYPPGYVEPEYPG